MIFAFNCDGIQLTVIDTKPLGLIFFLHQDNWRGKSTGTLLNDALLKHFIDLPLNFCFSEEVHNGKAIQRPVEPLRSREWSGHNAGWEVTLKLTQIDGHIHRARPTQPSSEKRLTVRTQEAEPSKVELQSPPEGLQYPQSI